MVELQGIEHSDVFLKHGVHRVADVFSTGMQLKDHDRETVDGIVADDSYYSFAVVREPIRRIISAYTEKFVLNRLDTGNHLHTGDVLRTVRASSKPDFEEGISFREFVEYLASTSSDRLDPHWAPQYLFLQGLPRFRAVFTMNQLSELGTALSERVGSPVEVGQHNRGMHARTEEETEAGRYVDLTPAELDKLDSVSSNDFIAPDLVAKLEARYREDIDLYAAADSGLLDYRPGPAVEQSNDGLGDNLHLSTAPEIAHCLSIYSKGYFVLDGDGEGEIGVVITNTSTSTLDFGAVGTVHVEYRLRDAVGNILGDPLIYDLDIHTLSPDASESINHTLNVPAELRDQVRQAIIWIRLGDNFHVEEVSGLHGACAQRLGVA